MPHNLNIPTNLTIEDLIKKIQQYKPQVDADYLRLVYNFAATAHAGQFRKSGEPYIAHPLAASYILATMKIDTDIIIATLLHDVPEDTAVTLEEIEKNFGPDIAAMVRGITKLGKLKYRGMERYIENLRKMFMAMAEDVRVMIIKFADRTHNLLTLDALPEKKRERIALESLEIFAPIANRLGMGEFKGMLEDLSFMHLQPKEFAKTKQIRDQTLTDTESYIDEIMTKLKHGLEENRVGYLSVYGRKKQLYSLYQKLQKKDWQADKIHDILAVRIIVKNIADCYAALGIIHKLWRPISGKIKDYIAQPKPNGYQSLHTTILGDKGKIVEFQIRTEEMHNEAEFGVAAHWLYDEKGSRLIPARDIGWAKELARIQKDILVNMSDLEDLKLDFFQNRIFAFTPQGDVIDLPENATPVDFAYHIHTDIGNQCSGARVNEQMVSLDTPLKSGDIVEIITDKNRKKPNADWIKFVKTHMAKSRIRDSVKKNSPLTNWIKKILPKKK